MQVHKKLNSNKNDKDWKWKGEKLHIMQKLIKRKQECNIIIR